MAPIANSNLWILCTKKSCIYILKSRVGFGSHFRIFSNEVFREIMDGEIPPFLGLDPRLSLC